jgi:hypothetical protein
MAVCKLNFDVRRIAQFVLQVIGYFRFGSFLGQSKYNLGGYQTGDVSRGNCVENYAHLNFYGLYTRLTYHLRTAKLQ